MKKNQPTIHDLRRQGYKVAVQHNVDTRSTRIILTTADGKHAEGFASTHHEDQYNRKIGNAIAVGRALKNLKNGLLCDPPAFIPTQIG
jgi:Domain of unknown function (DUF1876)